MIKKISEWTLQEVKENISMHDVANFYADIIINQNGYDVRQVINNKEFRETSNVISCARSWNLSGEMIDYVLKYGINIVNYALYQLMIRTDESKAKEEPETRPIADGSENEVTANA